MFSLVSVKKTSDETVIRLYSNWRRKTYLVSNQTYLIQSKSFECLDGLTSSTSTQSISVGADRDRSIINRPDTTHLSHTLLRLSSHSPVSTSPSTLSRHAKLNPTLHFGLLLLLLIINHQVVIRASTTPTYSKIIPISSRPP